MTKPIGRRIRMAALSLGVSLCAVTALADSALTEVMEACGGQFETRGDIASFLSSAGWVPAAEDQRPLLEDLATLDNAHGSLPQYELGPMQPVRQQLIVNYWIDTQTGTRSGPFAIMVRPTEPPAIVVVSDWTSAQPVRQICLLGIGAEMGLRDAASLLPGQPTPAVRLGRWSTVIGQYGETGTLATFDMLTVDRDHLTDRLGRTPQLFSVLEISVPWQ